MKVRAGFVSNSSSSSFLIGAKEELSREQLKEVVSQALMVPKESPLSYLVDEIVDLLASRQVMTLKELAHDCYYDSVEELLHDDSDVRMVVGKGFTNFYHGRASDDGDIAEQVLCNLELFHEDENIIIRKSGGY